MAHSLETTSSPQEVWARLELRKAEDPKQHTLRREPLALLVWESPSALFSIRYKATLHPSDLGTRFRLQLEWRGPLAWLFRLFQSRRLKHELPWLARRLAGAPGGC